MLNLKILARLNKTKLSLASAILALPMLASANGGGPLLVIFSLYIFIYGQVWILGTETYIFIKETGVKTAMAFKQVFFANLVSTLLIGIAFPLLLATITYAATSSPGPFGDILSAVGTWAYDSAPYGEFVFPITLVWIVVSFLMTMYCERKFYLWYWQRTNFSFDLPINKFILKMHLVSYAGLVALITIYIVLSSL